MLKFNKKLVKMFEKCIFILFTVRIFKDEVPNCTECDGIVKPDIVFFGENLPSRFFECIEQDFAECELLVVLGSSLVVQPFASLIDKYVLSCYASS